jgi:hypothetical protein
MRQSATLPFMFTRHLAEALIARPSVTPNDAGRWKT